MALSDTSHRVFHVWRGVLLSLFIAQLTACGSSEQTPHTAQPTAPKQAAATTTPTATAQTAGAATTPGETESTPPPVQVSETDDGSESTAETPTVTTTPTLKLASAASPEPKTTPSSFKEGVNYQRLVPTQPTNSPPGQVEIVEIFWYGCPHCFALDPKLESWRGEAVAAGNGATANAQQPKPKPGYVVFERVPGAINEVALFHARVFYTAELLGKLPALHTPIFREIHLNGNLLNTMDKAKAFFAANGVAQADFDKVFASFALESKIQNANLLMRRYRVTGVPFFIVNGKFTTDVASAGGEEQLLQLLNELAAREHVN